MTEPEVSGVAVLKVGKISASPDEIEVVTTLTSGRSWS